MMDERLHSRMLELELLEFKYNMVWESYTFKDFTIHWTELTTMNNNEWKVLMEKIKEQK